MAIFIYICQIVLYAYINLNVKLFFRRIKCIIIYCTAVMYSSNGFEFSKELAEINNK